LRRHHRLAGPVLAASFSRLDLDAEVVFCSSSGWAHGIHATGRKIVYCHTPARWLYQTDRYLGHRRPIAGTLLKAARPYLRKWDQQAAHSAQRYLTQSTAVRNRIRAIYGIEAEILPAPSCLGMGDALPVSGLDPGFFLCVSRLLPYKNLDAIIDAARVRPDIRLVVAGTGPEEARLRQVAPGNVQLLGRVTDEQLRWLYANCAALIAASFEDYGLTPLEAAAYGKPTAALRWGGYLDTVVEGKTGFYFDAPSGEAIGQALRRITQEPLSPIVIRRHGARYSENAFISRLQAVVGEEGRPPAGRPLPKAS
jgi:glycosyltransferase involved in cell wall biosynthesis